MPSLKMWHHASNGWNIVSTRTTHIFRLGASWTTCIRPSLSSVFFLHTTDFLEIWPEYTLLCYTTLCGFQNQQIRGPMGKSGDSLAPLDLASRIHFHSITSEFFKFCLIAVQIQTHGCRGTAQLHNNEHHNSGGLR